MKSERLLDAIGKIDDELIYSSTTRARRPAWVRWGALAACLCIIVGGVLLVPRLTQKDDVPISKPFAGTESISANGLQRRGSLGGGISSQYYNIVHEEAVGNSPIKDSTSAVTMPVYHSVDSQDSAAVYELFTQEWKQFQKRAKTLGIKLVEGNVTGNGERYDPNVDYSEYAMYGFGVALSGDGAEVQLSNIVDGSWIYVDWDGLEQLFNKYHELDPITTESTDKEVLTALSPVAEFAGELLRVEFSIDITTLRRGTLREDNAMWVWARVTGGSTHLSGETLAYEMCERALYMLRIRLVEGEDGVYRLDMLNTNREYYKYIGNYELITVEEAEELLNKGYVLSGTMCPVCSAEEPEVDFSTYDAVEIIYQESGAEYLIPVYAFYKDLGMREYNDGSGEYRAYARVCVPAVEVEGMDEFFAERAAQHDELDT